MVMDGIRMRKVAVVVGTRPDAIKMALVIRRLREHRDRIDTTVVATAQHREMLDQVLNVFGITPDVDLDLMQAGQELGGLTARLLVGLESLWQRTAPDLVLVQGDTTSSFAASLAAYYCRIPVGHVEAGLRSHQPYAPFPEEMNRKLIDALAAHCFAPTEQARAHLLAEGIAPERIDVTGNTGVDALLFTLQEIARSGFVPEQFGPAALQDAPMLLVTAHRRESFGGGVERICAALKAIGEARPDVAIICPVHPNPHIYEPLTRLLGGIHNIYLTGPLDYRSFVYAASRARLVLTDSGGIQEEVPSLGKHVLVMRDVTERIEAVQAGIAELVGTETSRIVARTLALLEEPANGRTGANPFGDGKASERIVQRILKDATGAESGRDPQAGASDHESTRVNWGG